ncbi:hypothetical protein C8F01DRAFT_92765 [Mycena amicta]|nr:hypothetical protein C8F01DRAFT_92765 [Mycena amicta]
MRCLKGENVLVSVGLNGQGLNGQDDNFDKLSLLWEQLQLSAYEPASQPEADLVSFAQSAPFFGLIAVRPATSKLTPSEPVAKKTVLDEHSLPEPHPTPSSLSKIDPFADICDFGHSPLKTESVSQNNVGPSLQ